MPLLWNHGVLSPGLAGTSHSCFSVPSKLVTEQGNLNSKISDVSMPHCRQCEVKAKPRHLRVLLSFSPQSGLKGVRPPVQFEERPRDCSPGHAGKEGLHLAMTEASRGFSGAGEPVWDFSRGMTGSSGSLSCGAREVKSPCEWRGGMRHCS